MFAPLRTLMIALWAACLAGGAVILFLSLGWVSWPSFVAAGALGLLIGVPAGLWSARAIKREDPNWPPRRRRPQRRQRS
ncbi:hypothetical protein QO034_17915 [Sedimentitalea sp. JM2-8]|uniref:Uncharacterized protein n=1 Tax=Sedimentitalea xiamensis TaxID=3050037 RepID=A0ABT7FIW0_9RHOB|nr:hypothetical protein [Sedimentitalea xiamensis]MDK3074970.1 hypothetical protein [Sedimentitalea xiamensis]